MKAPQFSNNKLSAASEYALIFGAGASAAMSLAAQQVAAASVPVTALVAIGLLNRHRLDQRIKDGEPLGSTLEEKCARQADIPQAQVTAQPLPETVTVQPRPATVPGPAAKLRFAPKRETDKEHLRALQQASLQKIGTYLQQVRLEQALSLQQIHQQTYIQRYALQALETGDLASLPEPFYIRAFIEKYASALGLQGAEIAARFPLH
jgi:hypothetical protein